MRRILDRRVILLVPVYLGLACAGVVGEPEEIPITVAPTREAAGPSSTPSPAQSPSPTPGPEASLSAPGDPPGFADFASEIAAALEGKEAAFFASRASITTWYCLGDTIGVCTGQPDGAVLEGMPVTRGWQEYEVLGQDDYQAAWQEVWDRGASARLHAIGHRWGENPLMPMAAEAHQAIIKVEAGRVDDPEVHVLFLEYADGRWKLQGELIVTEGEGGWLEGSCTACFDEWSAW